MKRITFMKSPVHNQSGSVSLLLLIILPVFLLFCFACLAILHLQSTQRELQTGVQATARSVLAQFDSTLHSYGLFGMFFEQEAGLDIAKKIMQSHIPNSNSSLRIVSNQSLADVTEFQRQLVSEMKIRVPFQMALSLYQRLGTQQKPPNQLSGEKLSTFSQQLLSLTSIKDVAINRARSMIRDLDEQIRSIEEMNHPSILEKYQSLVSQLEQLQQLDSQIRSKMERILGTHASIVQTKPFKLLPEMNVGDFSTSTLRNFLKKLDDQLVTESSTESERNKQKNYQNQIDAAEASHAETELLSCNQKSLDYKELLKTAKHYSDFNQKNKVRKSLYERMLSGEFSIQSFNKTGQVTDFQEAEFIAIGGSSCEANRLAVAAHIFAVRSALRLTEFFLRPELVGPASTTPLSLCLAAFSFAAVHATKDLQRLIIGETVPLFFNRAIETSYVDYLRFVLLTMDERKKISRIQSVIAQVCSCKLNEMTTSVTVTGSIQTSFSFLVGKTWNLSAKSTYSYFNR